MNRARPNRTCCCLQVLALVIGLGSTMRPARADGLTRPDACSDRIQDMMSDGMVMAYLFMDWMCMPMMGMCDQAMGEFFSMILDDPPLTLEFMDCADANPELIGVMIKVVDANPELLYKMGHIMGVSCEFTRQMAEMSLHHENLREFFFAKVDDHIYDNVTVSLLCDPPTVAERMGEVFKLGAERHLQPGMPMFTVMNRLGATNDDDDGNELANERMLQAFFRHLPAANAFLDALDSLDPENQQVLLDVFFLGQTSDRYGGSQVHPNQVYYQNYAIMTALADGVIFSYQADLGPDPESTNPANRLMGRMMPWLLPPGNPADRPFSEYGLAFFRAVRSAAEVHCDSAAMKVLQAFQSLLSQDLVAQLPVANPDAPAPRDAISGKHYSRADTCEMPTCAPDFPDLCLTEADCLGAGLIWCPDGCKSAPCFDPPGGGGSPGDPGTDPPPENEGDQIDRTTPGSGADEVVIAGGTGCGSAASQSQPLPIWALMLFLCAALWRRSSHP